jgi:hypothetical protein
MTSVIDETVNLNELSVRGNLIVGLYDGADADGGFTSMTFVLDVDGIQEVDQTFTSAAAAKTYFTDDALNLGSLASGQPLGGSTLSIQATLTVTGATAGSDFEGDLIIGDPPAASRASHPVLVGAMAAFGAGGAHSAGASWMTEPQSMTMIAGPRAAIA